MMGKSKVLEFDETLSNFSIGETELSELDSEVHSITSIRSCAESWVLENEYKGPAQSWIVTGLITSLGVSAASVLCAYGVFSTVAGSPVDNLEWARILCAFAVALPATGILFFFAAKRRSKRMLLLVQAMLLALYTASTIVGVNTIVSPTMLKQTVRQSCPHDLG